MGAKGQQPQAEVPQACARQCSVAILSYATTQEYISAAVHAPEDVLATLTNRQVIMENTPTSAPSSSPRSAPSSSPINPSNASGFQRRPNASAPTTPITPLPAASHAEQTEPQAARISGPRASQSGPRQPGAPVVAAGMISGPRGRMRASVSTPLTSSAVYGPGPFFALAILLLPVITALVGVIIFVTSPGPLPIWLPLLLLLWLPILGAIWSLMKTVRLSTAGVAIGRPGSAWVEMPWEYIERVETRGPFIRIADTQRRSMSFAPRLLVDGLRLRRQLLLRLPPQTLSASLRQEAQSLITGDITDMATGGLTDVRARPRRRWATIGIGGFLALAALAGVVLRFLPLAASIPLAVLLLAPGLALLAGAFWLRQLVSVGQQGISVRGWFGRKERTMAWEEIELLEVAPGEIVIRFRGVRKLLCPGPALFRPIERNRMRAFIHAYCLDRGAPLAPRFWLF